MISDKLDELINNLALQIKQKSEIGYLSELELKIILWSLFNQAYAIVRKELYGD